jgi:hypothetical protein
MTRKTRFPGSRTNPLPSQEWDFLEMIFHRAAENYTSPIPATD